MDVCEAMDGDSVKKQTFNFASQSTLTVKVLSGSQAVEYRQRQTGKLQRYSLSAGGLKVAIS